MKDLLLGDALKDDPQSHSEVEEPMGHLRDYHEDVKFNVQQQRPDLECGFYVDDLIRTLDCDLGNRSRLQLMGMVDGDPDFDYGFYVEDLLRILDHDLVFLLSAANAMKMCIAQRSSREGYWCNRKFDMMTESKMFGSSRRDKTEMPLGNPSVSKRTFISLEVDGFDNIPTQVISLSKMSRSQLKELKAPLRYELQQVSIRRKKILSRWSKKVTLSTCNQNRSVNKSDHIKNSSQSKPLSSEVNECQKVDNATSERQVKKLYHATLLRSRFADTILKAQEKTLGLGESWSANKLKQARMELERQHSKGKKGHEVAMVEAIPLQKFLQRGKRSTMKLTLLIYKFGILLPKTQDSMKGLLVANALKDGPRSEVEEKPMGHLQDYHEDVINSIAKIHVKRKKINNEVDSSDIQV